MHHAGDFRRVYFSESLFNSHEDDVKLVITLAMVAFLALRRVKYVSYMPFYNVYEKRHEICI